MVKVQDKGNENKQLVVNISDVEIMRVCSTINILLKYN